MSGDGSKEPRNRVVGIGQLPGLPSLVGVVPAAIASGGDR